jgi:hypothetical protein
MANRFEITGDANRRVGSLHELAEAVREACGDGLYSADNARVRREGDLYRTDLVVNRRRVAGLVLDPRTGRFEVLGLGWWREPGRLAGCLIGCGLDRDMAGEASVAINRAFHEAEADYGRDIPYGTVVSRD